MNFIGRITSVSSLGQSQRQDGSMFYYSTIVVEKNTFSSPKPAIIARLKGELALAIHDIAVKNDGRVPGLYEVEYTPTVRTLTREGREPMQFEDNDVISIQLIY